MKKVNKLMSIWLIASFLSISGCFKMPNNYHNSNSITIDSNTNITQHNSEQYITECFLGFHFGMTQYDVSQNLETQKNDFRYSGTQSFYGVDCYKFYLNSGYIYIPKQNFCYYHEGVAFWFEFFIEQDEFYSFVDAYKNSKNRYTFYYDKANNANQELYRFTKSNLSIDCYRNYDIVRIMYYNQPVWEKVMEEQEAEEDDNTYNSDF